MSSQPAVHPDPLGERLLSFFWRKPTDSLGERTRRRVALHLIPYLFFLYILAYLDRVNVSVAQLGMEKGPAEGGLGMSLDVIGFGAGLFFWGYWILEVPSTLSVVRWGARWVFVRILVLWGLCAALVGMIGTPFCASLFGWLPHLSEASTFASLRHTAAFINHLHDDPTNQFYFFRFMLGFFEGGFFPSVIVYLSLWFRPQDRAKAIAGFMSAIPLSSLIGVPLSGLLLPVNWLGLPGWRWVFLLEGVAPVLAGIATLFMLPDRPAKAKWLPADERAWLLAELEREQKDRQGHGHWEWMRHLGMVLALTVVYFGLNVTSYGLSMFLPAIIKSQSGVSNQTASLIAALPYLMAAVAMFINGRHSDRTGERFWHVAVPLSVLSCGIWLAAGLNGVWLVPVLVMIFIVGPAMYAHLPAFWPIPTMFLGSVAAASAIGFINMIGNLGGFVGPAVVGDAASYRPTPAAAASATGLLASPCDGSLAACSELIAVHRPNFTAGLLRIAPWPLAAAVIILIAGYTRSRAGEKAAPAAAGSKNKPKVGEPGT
jgi:ACS family tartrate transporter-like MFS transporter